MYERRVNIWKIPGSPKMLGLNGVHEKPKMEREKKMERRQLMNQCSDVVEAMMICQNRKSLEKYSK